MTDKVDKTPQNQGYRRGYGLWVHAAALAAALAATWLLLSGQFEILLLFFGILSVAIAVAIALRMEVVDHEGIPVHVTWEMLRYVPWLAWEVVKANIDVARLIIAPKLAIDPVLFETKTSQRTDLGQMIYANSITLTPGTVSVDLDLGMIRVHAISRAGMEALEEGEMDRRVARLEGA